MESIMLGMCKAHNDGSLEVISSKTVTTVMWTYLGEIGHLTLMRGLQWLHSLVFLLSSSIWQFRHHCHSHPTVTFMCSSITYNCITITITSCNFLIISLSYQPHAPNFLPLHAFHPLWHYLRVHEPHGHQHRKLPNLSSSTSLSPPFIQGLLGNPGHCSPSHFFLMSCFTPTFQS